MAQYFRAQQGPNAYHRAAEFASQMWEQQQVKQREEELQSQEQEKQRQQTMRDSLDFMIRSGNISQADVPRALSELQSGSFNPGQYGAPEPTELERMQQQLEMEKTREQLGAFGGGGQQGMAPPQQTANFSDAWMAAGGQSPSVGPVAQPQQAGPGQDDPTKALERFAVRWKMMTDSAPTEPVIAEFLRNLRLTGDEQRAAALVEAKLNPEANTVLSQTSQNARQEDQQRFTAGQNERYRDPAGTPPQPTPRREGDVSGTERIRVDVQRDAVNKAETRFRAAQAALTKAQQTGDDEIMERVHNDAITAARALQEARKRLEEIVQGLGSGGVNDNPLDLDL
jgi:hypothetical protein